ncbi:MAG TPA: DUF2182 domain-containing protein [Stellaceae bacterium]|nr:DUF2182 domain-containing protein [Stellaceae bacterium]
MLAALWGTVLVAWGAIAFGSGTVTLPWLCAPMASARDLTAELQLVLALNSPGALAMGWILMVSAMMPPIIAEPLRHVRDRSFARRRGRATALFVAGYGATWMLAGAILSPVAIVVHSTGLEPFPSLALAALVVLAWQVSPAKQRFLNRCHHRPALAAFGAAADRDSFVFGLTQGASCVGTCWAIMLLSLLFTSNQLLTMGTAELFLLGERLERPTSPKWRLRGPNKSIRMVAAQLYQHLAHQSRGNTTSNTVKKSIVSAERR